MTKWKQGGSTVAAPRGAVKEAPPPESGSPGAVTEGIPLPSGWQEEESSQETRHGLVGECIDIDHPTLRGRVLVRWTTADGEERTRWLPTLQNLAVRPKDRLILINPANWDEMVVTGVIDGFAKRPEVRRQTAGRLELERDEAIRVTGRDGQELVEVFQTDEGPVVRVLNSDAGVELPGKLRLAADSIELEAGAGPIKIKASDDVIVNGEMIHLN